MRQRWYRLWHVALDCQIGAAPTRAALADLYWRLSQAHVLVAIVPDWLDLPRPPPPVATPMVVQAPPLDRSS